MLQRNSDKVTALKMFRHKIMGLGMVTDELWQSFESGLKYMVVDKKKELTNIGEMEKNIYYIIEGAVHVFVKYKGKEVSTNFRFANQFTSSVTSYILGAPSEYCISTLTDCKLIVIPKEHLDNIYRIFPEFNKLGRTVMEYLLIEKRKRELELLTLSAEEMYRELMKKDPKVVLEIPLKYIASFIGITPESLSRVRSKVLNSLEFKN